MRGDPHPLRQPARVVRHAQAVPHRIAVLGLDRLAPLLHQQEEIALQPVDPVLDVRRVRLRLQPGKERMRAVQRRQGVAVAALLAQRERQLTLRLRFQERVVRTRQVGGTLQVDHGQVGLAAVPVDHPVELQSFRLVADVSQLAEDLKGFVAALPRPREVPPRDVDLGPVHGHDPAELNVPGVQADRVRALEELFRPVQLAEIDVQHPQVVEHGGDAAVAASLLHQRQPAEVARIGLVQIPPDVGDDPEVLLHVARESEVVDPECGGERIVEEGFGLRHTPPRLRHQTQTVEGTAPMQVVIGGGAQLQHLFELLERQLLVARLAVAVADAHQHVKDAVDGTHVDGDLEGLLVVLQRGGPAAPALRGTRRVQVMCDQDVLCLIGPGGYHDGRVPARVRATWQGQPPDPAYAPPVVVTVLPPEPA